MDTFQPLINLLVLLTALSIAAERATNLLKLRHPTLRARGGTTSNDRAEQTTARDRGEKKQGSDREEKERDREYGIAGRAVFVGVALAVFVKADFFEILAHLEDPWRTLGWVQVQGNRWLGAQAMMSWTTLVYALGGSVITGVALGFGTKFWHDVLGTVYEVRSIARQRKQGLEKSLLSGGTDAD
jgi:hypothetical protein